MSHKHDLQRLHQKGSRGYYEAVACALLFFCVFAVSILAWSTGDYPLLLGCWLLQAHIGHENLLAFHEAAHFVLHPNRLGNEAHGLLVGSMILTPLSVYRWVHNQHHRHLATERDTELWPYVDPSVPRGKRLLTAAGELLLGLVCTPILFLRGVLVAERMPGATARRIAWEYALSVGLWALVLGVVGYFRAWEVFAVSYVVPAWISGNLQSLRKFTEHMGLLGDDVPSTTRTVVDTSLLGRLWSASMLHIDLHGPHHRYAKIPHFRLREATPLVYEKELREPAGANLFPSYPAAVWAMLKTLGDPRVGAQWIRQPKKAGESLAGNLPG